MLLVNCTECDDVFRPHDRERLCVCGKTSALELTGERVQVSGFARVLELRWDEYDGAVLGKRYSWAVAREPDATIDRVT